MLLSVTVMVKLASAVAEALSVTRIVTGKLPGPALSPGVHVKTPVVGDRGASGSRDEAVAERLRPQVRVVAATVGTGA